MSSERVEPFERDPGWEARNNRVNRTNARTIRQDFGFNRTNHAGGTVGEIGGFITPTAEPAYYAKKIPSRTFRDTLTASGTLICPTPKFHLLLGFFNNRNVQEWRTPSQLYRNPAVGSRRCLLCLCGVCYTEVASRGRLSRRLCHGSRPRDRLDEVKVNGESEDFSRDPGWEAFQNRRTYQTTQVRPHGDFGYSATQFTGGQSKGELGGLVFRGDCRYSEAMACYGDRLSVLTLEKPLKASSMT